jgi:hypothetical protein
MRGRLAKRAQGVSQDGEERLHRHFLATQAQGGVGDTQMQVPHNVTGQRVVTAEDVDDEANDDLPVLNFTAWTTMPELVGSGHLLGLESEKGNDFG